MLGTVANRAGCVFWSAAESRRFIPAKHPVPDVARDTPVRAPSAPPEVSARAWAPACPAWLLRAWQWLCSWVPRDAAAATPPATPPPATTPPAAAPRPSPAPLVSHPIDWEADAFDSESDDAPFLPRGVDVPPQPLQPQPPGLEVKFAVSRDIAAPMQALAEVICDSERGHTWIDRCKQSRLLLSTSTGPIAWHHYQLPKLGDRDAVTRSTVDCIDANTLRITVQPWEHPSAPQTPDVARIAWVDGSFTLQALDAEHTRVTHASKLVLDGAPRWLSWPIKLMRSKSPKQTLENLARLVAQS